MDELATFRFNSIESEMQRLIATNHDMAEGISSLADKVSKIHSQIDRIASVSDMLTDRISVLENDLQERSIRKKIYKSLFTFYPFIILILLILIGMDHQKILEMINVLQLIH